METRERHFVTLDSLKQLIKDNSDSELNKDGKLTDKIMELLDIPSYDKCHFKKYTYLNTDGSVVYSISLINGVWKDCTEIEQLKNKIKETEKEFVELQQEIKLNNG